MGRIRSIYPDACISETLVKITPGQERTFWRLLTHCDDKGRSLANPRLIKAAIYPLHDDMTPQAVQADLEGLATVGLIQFYTVEGRGYLFVTSWGEFQHPKNPTPSRLPEPPQGLPLPTLVLPQDLPSPNPLELGDGERSTGEVSPVTPLGANAPDSGSHGKRKRRTHDEILQPYPQEVRDVANHCIHVWRKEDPDGRPIVCDKDLLCANVAAVLRDHKTLTSAELIQGADDYLAKEKQRYCAPQFYFGPGKPGETPHWAVQTRMIRHQESRKTALPLEPAS